MMRRAYLTKPIATTTAAGMACEIPVGSCGVLERTHWIALTWRAAEEMQQVELPLREYVSHVESGCIHFGDSSSARSPAPALKLGDAAGRQHPAPRNRAWACD